MQQRTGAETLVLICHYCTHFMWCLPPPLGRSSCATHGVALLEALGGMLGHKEEEVRPGVGDQGKV